MWKRIRGFDPDEDVDSATETWLSRVHPDDRDRIRETIAKQDSGEIPRNAFEYRERHRDGHYIWISAEAGRGMVSRRTAVADHRYRHRHHQSQEGRGRTPVRQYASYHADGNVSRRHPGGRRRCKDHLVQPTICRDVENPARCAARKGRCARLAAVTSAMLDPRGVHRAGEISLRASGSRGSRRAGNHGRPGHRSPHRGAAHACRAKSRPHLVLPRLTEEVNRAKERELRISGSRPRSTT